MNHDSVFWTFELIKIGNVLPKLILSTNLPSSRLRWAGNIPSTTSLTESRTRGGTMKLLPYSVVLLSVALALGGCADRGAASVGDPSGGSSETSTGGGNGESSGTGSDASAVIQAPTKETRAAIHAMKKAHAFAKSTPRMSAKMVSGSSSKTVRHLLPVKCHRYLCRKSL